MAASLGLPGNGGNGQASGNGNGERPSLRPRLGVNVELPGAWRAGITLNGAPGLAVNLGRSF